MNHSTNSVLFLLYFHIACGFSAILAALGAMLSTKGAKQHRKFGSLFFYAMTGVFITAIPLALFINNLFLFLIALFSYYLAFSGWRYAKNRSGPQRLDLIVSLSMLIVSILMMGTALLQMHQNKIILMLFGAFGLLFSFSDIKLHYTHSSTGKQRIAHHLGAMLGATIAALTAFAVTNISIQPTIILWLGPTFLITPVIMWWKNKVLKGNVPVK